MREQFTQNAQLDAASRDEIVVILETGEPVEVRRRFDQRWSRGFEIESSEDDGYRLRRRSDGAVLPIVFAATDVRASQPPAVDLRRNNG